MDYIEFECAVEDLVEMEVFAWDQFEQYCHAAWGAGLDVDEAVAEVTAQYRQHV